MLTLAVGIYPRPLVQVIRQAVGRTSDTTAAAALPDHNRALAAEGFRSRRALIVDSFRSGVEDHLVEQVLSHYPAPLRQGQLQSLGNLGGFSGARLWCLRDNAGSLRIRAWPVDASLPERLRLIHHLMDMARSAGLAFVPSVYRTAADTTFVICGGRVWDVCEWKTGIADYKTQPSPSAIASELPCPGAAPRCLATAGAGASRPLPCRLTAPPIVARMARTHGIGVAAIVGLARPSGGCHAHRSGLEITAVVAEAVAGRLALC